jgi:peptide/nickel transport system ATP-binding protein
VTEAISEQPGAALEARELSKHFPLARRQLGMLRTRPVVRAVDAVSLALHAREVVALVGESGSGKSTLALMLARLERPTAGRLLVDGVPASGSFRDYCKKVQIVFQDPYASLNPVHTVRHHLTRPLQIHGTADGDLDTRVNELLELVKLVPADQFRGKFPHELSGGQRQRVAIARALAAGPAVLLADEPVSMLDVSIRLGVLNLLGELCNRLGLAVLYITHDIASARYFASVTQVMYAGELVEGGPSEAVTQAPAHPYTQLLIASAPDPEQVASRARDEAQGEPPNMIAPPAGCRFHPRCRHAMTICSRQAPTLTQLGGGHWVRCWLHSTSGASADMSVQPGPGTQEQDP